MKGDHIELQKIHVIWYSFCVLGESFARTFEYKELLLARSWSFWFETMKIDWIWRKVFERFVTILTASVDIVGAFSFQLVLVLGKLDCKVKIFFIEELKIL